MATRSRTGREPREPKNPRVHGGGMSTVNPIEAAGGGLALLGLPVLCFMGLGPAVGWVFWQWCHANQMQWLGALWAACGAFLTVGLYDHAFAGMRWEQRRLAIAAGYATVCWAWIILLGPSKTWFGVNEVLGVTGALWWFLAKTDPYRSHGDDGAWQRSVGLAESARPVVVEDSDKTLRVRTLHPDNTHEDVDRSLPKIAVKAKAAVDGWVREPVVLNGKVVSWMSDLVYRRNSRMDNPGMWPGPDRPGQGIWLPIPYGLAADGALSCVQLTPDPSAKDANYGSPGHGVAGQAGAGKTAFCRNTLGTVVARTGVMLWGADPSKAANWVNFLRPALDWFESDPSKVRAMLLAAKLWVELATDIMGVEGITTWEPRCWTELGLPALVLWLEECQPYLDPLLEEIKQGIQVWRSAGVHVILSMQQMSESNMDTDIRSLIPEMLQFRCARDVDAAMTLGHDLVDAGASPHKIPLRGQEGMHWAKLLNEDPTRWAMKRRTWQDDLEKLVRATAEHAPYGLAAMHPVMRHRLWTYKVGRLDVGKAYRERERIGLKEWATHPRWKQPFLLKAGIRELVAKASDLAAEEPPTDPGRPPDPPPPGSSAKPGHVFRLPPPPRDDPAEEAPVDREPAYAADENVVDLESDHAEQIAEELETDRIDAEIDADVTADLGPDDQEDTMGRADPDQILAEAHRGQPAPGLDYGDPNQQEWAPAPTPKQRARNFQAMIRKLLNDDDLRQQGPDGTFWVVVDSERLGPAWHSFPGERPELRPSLYRRLHAHEKHGHVKDLGRGSWAISAAVLDGTPLELPEDYDPADDDVSEEEMQALVDRLAV